jgi:hypothetical protein
MTLNLWLLTMLPPLLAGLGLSLLLEQTLTPRPKAIWLRPFATGFIHIGIYLLLFGGELLLFRRPWFAMANVMALQLLVVLVSNAKYAVLREAFVFQDFEYFTDAIKHPRLYLPFLGIWKTLLATTAFVSALLAGLILESSLLVQFTVSQYGYALATIILAGGGLLWLGAKQTLPVSFDTDSDLPHLGLFSSLWCYAAAEAKPCHPLSPYDHFSVAADRAGPVSNLVVVQSESFFDVRDFYTGIAPDVLQAYDRIKASARQYGKLQTPAWGANTVRTEFGFLSGMTAAQLGVHRFNPYRKLARQSVGNLAGFLKKSGYRTICVHPYPAGFYNRDIVFPLLGFDEFIDIKSFTDADKAGPFVGDIALAEKVCSLLQLHASQPVFIFVISMENHGPLHLEKVQPEDSRFYTTQPPATCEDLTIYLRHLHNADHMAGRLREQLAELPGDNWLCWYGDHVPIMADVYKTLGLPDGHTDYLLWRSGSGGEAVECLDLSVERLGVDLLGRMGLVACHYNTGV